MRSFYLSCFIFIISLSSTIKVYSQVPTVYFDSKCEFTNQKINKDKDRFDYELSCLYAQVEVSMTLLKFNSSSALHTSFLESIKAATTFKYEDATIKGENGIYTFMMLEGYYAAHLAFYYKGFSVTMMIKARTPEERAQIVQGIEYNFDIVI